MNWPSRPDIAPARIRTRSTGGGGMTRFGRSNTSIGGSVTMATSKPASAARTAWTAPASGRRVAPSRTRTANGGRRCRAARWRASDARKSRRSLLASPATTTPHTPIARARVSVSASTREPTTRIVPADPTSRPPERSSPSAPSWRRPRVGPPSATMPRMPRPAARMVIPVPGRTSRTMPANGVSSASVISPVATRHRSCQSKTYSPVGPPSAPRRVLPVQRAPGRGGVRRRRRVDLVEPGVADQLGDRRPDDHRIAGRDQRPVARGQREQRVDRGVDQASGRAPGGRRLCSRVASVQAASPATTRASPRAGRPGRAAAAGRRAGRPPARRGRRSPRSRSDGRGHRA